MSLINNAKIVQGAAPSVGFEYPYSIDYAGKFDGTADLAQTATTTTGWTFSAWVKRTSFGSAHQIIDTEVQFNAGDTITAEALTTTAVFRDPSHWYHIHISDNGLYINGVSFGAVTTGTLTNPDLFDGFDGYAAEVYFVDGTTVAYTSFGEYQNGTWVPKKYTGAYGTNGYYLNFSNGSDLGEDSSGNGNDWTATSVAQTTDTPTNNFPTLDPIHELSTATISAAGLTCAGTENEYSTIAVPSSGKWGWEITVSENGSFGLEDVEGNEEVAADVSGEVVEMLVDMDNGYLQKKVDGGAVENIELSLDTAATWLPHFKAACTVDFGADSYTPSVAGYLPICTANWPAPEVIDGEEGLWVPTWTGDAADPRSITGAPFDPTVKGLVWAKNRDNATSHQLLDAVRGSEKVLLSNGTDAEQDIQTTTANGGLQDLLINGFNLVGGSGGNANLNASGQDGVAWVFNMLPKYGMDIVTYTGNGVAGRTVAHSLVVAPELILIKSRTGGDNWIAGCEYAAAANPWNYYLNLNLKTAATANIVQWNNTAPTDTVFTLGSGVAVNRNAYEHVAYLFRSVPGFLKVGYYTGNGNADGPRIHTGFRPKYVLSKSASTVHSWLVHDSVRNPNNLANLVLYPNLTNAEATTVNEIDFLANGFKIRAADATINQNASLHIYLAIADMAFPYVNAF